jgi:hypothetical protein
MGLAAEAALTRGMLKAARPERACSAERLVKFFLLFSRAIFLNFLGGKTSQRQIDHAFCAQATLKKATLARYMQKDMMRFYALLLSEHSGAHLLLVNEKFKKTLALMKKRTYFYLTQFRTCLWSRAGRWACGQEAAQPPGAKKKMWTSSSGHALRTYDRQPEQTGEPRSPRGTRLEATT